jgi:hypothetical protein
MSLPSVGRHVNLLLPSVGRHVNLLLPSVRRHVNLLLPSVGLPANVPPPSVGLPANASPPSVGLPANASPPSVGLPANASSPSVGRHVNLSLPSVGLSADLSLPLVGPPLVGPTAVRGSSRGSSGWYDDNFLTNGYIPYTFSPRAAASYYTVLFRVDPSVIQAYSHLGAFYVWNQPMIWTQPPLNFNGRPGWLLDYHIRPGGSVVPQQIWFPQGQGDWRRHVEQAQLQMPLFFVNADGTLGVPIEKAAAGHMHLRGVGERAPFGDKFTTKIRIGVCTLAPCARLLLTRHVAVARLCALRTAGPTEGSDSFKEPRDPRKVCQACRKSRMPIFGCEFDSRWWL